MFVSSSSTALIPGKRIKAAHRKFGAGMPLKAFARQHAEIPQPWPTPIAARAWLKNKGR